MANRIKNSQLILVKDNIQGEWNIPLLENAAAMSNAEVAEEPDWEQFNTVIVCEYTKRAENIYHTPAPAGKTAVVVGNEMDGVSKDILKRADKVVKIPMSSKTLTSVNVGVASAICLYVLSKNIARNGVPSSNIKQNDTDVLISPPDDPAEAGSMLRSVAAFGWSKAYTYDEYKSWFSDDRNRILLSRAAARRDNNPIKIFEYEKIKAERYKGVVHCSSGRLGVPLTRFRLQDKGRYLLGIGDLPETLPRVLPVHTVYVDTVNKKIAPAFRHMGSIFLSYISEMVEMRRKAK